MFRAAFSPGFNTPSPISRSADESGVLVDLGFSDEHEQLRGAVRKFLEAKSSEQAVRAQMETAEGYDSAVWRQMAEELGLQSLHLPEKHHGQGFTFVELGIVLEEMGRVLLPAPYFSTVCLAANAIINAGTDADQEELLPRIASGQATATLALTEPNGRWDAPGIAMEATRSGKSWVLSGTKTFVIDGHTASTIIAVARQPGSDGDQGIGFYVVDADAEGLMRTPLVTMDLTRKQARLDFDRVEARPLGDSNSGWSALSKTLDQASVCLANEMVGGAQRVIEMAVEYAKARMQFGRPIGSFQAIKHKCADMLLDVEASKSAAYFAAHTAADDNDELPVMASLAKAYCSDAYFHAAAENIQIHGGIGFTWEHPAHLYFKRAKSSELLLGDATYHRELLAQRIGM
jgi:alkylation response protein AidB-like acyl-CoA dehydrogenase